MTKNGVRSSGDIHDEQYIGSVARPNDIVNELDKLVRRTQKYESNRDAAYYAFRNAAFHCGKLMAYFWGQYQQIRRKEEETR